MQTITIDDVVVQRNGRVCLRATGATVGHVRDGGVRWKACCLRGACSWSGAIWLTRTGAVESLLKHWKESDLGR